MMRGPSCFAVAVRNAKGEIVIRDRPWRSLWEKLRFLRWPFLRGAVVLGESMANGMNALAYSAQIAAEGEAEKERSEGPQNEDGTAGVSPRRDSETTPRPAGRGAEATKNAPPSFGWLLIPTLLFALLVFKGVPHVTALALDSWFGGKGVSGFLFHIVDGVVKLLLFVGYLAAISRMKEIRIVFAYHGAEHKAIATHEAGEALTVEHAKAKSRFHPRCGTAFMLFVIVVGVLLYMTLLPLLPPLVATGWLNQALLILIKILLLFPIAGLSYEAIRLSGKFGNNPLVRILIAPGLLLQRLVTREPTDQQLEIALASIAVTLAREEATAKAREREKGAVLPERERVFASYGAFQEGLAGWDFGDVERPLAPQPVVPGP
jgi:uncharacterized protein YqhQ